MPKIDFSHGLDMLYYKRDFRVQAEQDNLYTSGGPILRIDLSVYLLANRVGSTCQG